jgi:hypothetical protein
MAIKPKITDYNRRDEIGKPLSPMVLKKTQKQKLKKMVPFSRVNPAEGLSAKTVGVTKTTGVAKTPAVKNVKFASSSAPKKSSSLSSAPKGVERLMNKGKRIAGRIQNKSERIANRVANKESRVNKRIDRLTSKLKK